MQDSDSVLVVVHPGYAGKRQLAFDKFGDYAAYMSRLKAAVRTRASIVVNYLGLKPEASPN